VKLNTRLLAPRCDEVSLHATGCPGDTAAVERELRTAMGFGKAKGHAPGCTIAGLRGYRLTQMPQKPKHGPPLVYECPAVCQKLRPRGTPAREARVKPAQQRATLRLAHGAAWASGGHDGR
jgi:hypothetical protein